MALENNFEGKVVWLTGASSGIGKELSIQLSRYRAKLILSSRNEKLLNELKSTLENSEDHTVLPLDLADAKSFPEKFKHVTEKYGQIDFLIQNGGISQRGTASESSEEVVRKIMEVNFFGNV